MGVMINQKGHIGAAMFVTFSGQRGSSAGQTMFLIDDRDSASSRRL